MFNLIRRISNGVILRPDRPWADDATSNAPTKGKKRRLERNADAEAAEEIKAKKIKGESAETTAPPPQPGSQPASAPEVERQQREEKVVREVTKGVKEVELSESRSEEVKPESVPLPGEDDAEELQEEGADASPSLEAGPEDGEVDGPSEPEPKAQEGEGFEEGKAEETGAPVKEAKKTVAASTEPAR